VILSLGRTIVKYKSSSQDPQEEQEHEQCVAFIEPLSLRDVVNKKLRYRRETARCVMSIEILPIATQNSAETTYTTSPDQIDGMKLEI